MSQRKQNLKNIAAEGFAMLEQHVHRYQQPKSHVFEVIIPANVAAQAKKEVVSIDCYQAAQMYGGTVIAEYRKTKKPIMRLPKFYK